MSIDFDRSNEDLEVKNAQEYLDKRRIMDIMDAELRVIIRRNEALDQDPFDRQAIVYEAVRDYIWLSKSIFFKVDGGMDYWNGEFEVPLGTVTHPQLDESEPIRGLEDFIHSNPPWEIAYAEHEDDIVKGRTETEYVELLHMPVDISMRAFEWTNDFLHIQAQLDLQIGPAGHVSTDPGL